MCNIWHLEEIRKIPVAIFGKICSDLTELQTGQCYHLYNSAVDLLNYWGRRCEHSVWMKCVSVPLRLLLPYIHMIHVTYKPYHSKSLDVWTKILCSTVIRIDMHHNFIAYWNFKKMQQMHLKMTWKFSHKWHFVTLEKIDGYMVILQVSQSIFVFKEKVEHNSNM